MNVLIDGEIKDSTEVNPRIHDYVGMFRFPFEHFKNKINSNWYDSFNGGCFYTCWGLAREAMINGEYDIPSYKTKDCAKSA